MTLTPNECALLVQEMGTIKAAAEVAGLPYSTFRYRLKLADRHLEGKDRVLIIGDTHCPVMLDGYVEFLQETYERYNCDRVVHIGDVVDWAAISYHRTPLTPSTPEEEFHAAKAQLADLVQPGGDL